MDENRYLTRLDRNLNNYHKFSKCYCNSKNYCTGRYYGMDDVAQEDSYRIKYYNSSQDGKKQLESHVRNKEKKHCEGCICSQLECFDPGTLVDVYLSDGHCFCGIYFIYLDPHSCCAYFLQIDDMARPVIIDCQQVNAISKTNTAS